MTAGKVRAFEVGLDTYDGRVGFDSSKKLEDGGLEEDCAHVMGLECEDQQEQSCGGGLNAETSIDACDIRCQGARGSNEYQAQLEYAGSGEHLADCEVVCDFEDGLDSNGYFASLADGDFAGLRSCKNVEHVAVCEVVTALDDGVAQQNLSRVSVDRLDVDVEFLGHDMNKKGAGVLEPRFRELLSEDKNEFSYPMVDLEELVRNGDYQLQHSHLLSGKDYDEDGALQGDLGDREAAQTT
ncbi:bifunctional aminodeoxychorismate synthase component I/aminodeoxychorismate [Sesbania bispinosa]|nr:bifunctional aminodeoxychorismate synthase component I/aminodeoxychorismate [Sesbania bispinosa]